MKKTKLSGNEHLTICFECQENVIIELRQLGREAAGRAGLNKEEGEKVAIAIEELVFCDLVNYGAADFLGIGKLVLTCTPEPEVEFIPYPKTLKKPGRRPISKKEFRA